MILCLFHCFKISALLNVSGRLFSFFTCRSSFCSGIFRAEQAVRRFILLNLGESADGLIETVVVLIIIAHGDFAQKYRASSRLQLKIMVHIGIDRNALPGLQPGESITVYPYMYHDFELEPGTGPVLLGEVSMCNDDENDNRFYEPIGRFPEIEEDEPPYRLLCTEYPRAEG